MTPRLRRAPSHVLPPPVLAESMVRARHEPVLAAMRPRHSLRTGEIVGGRFIVEQRLAAGGMGEVWSGRHRFIRMRVALKSLLPEAYGNPEIVTRFKREAYLLGLVRSDHVARVLDFVEDETHGSVLVMDLVEGVSLAEALRERRLTVEETVDLGVELAKGIGDLHRARIVHRDLKPANVVLGVANGETRGVIVDFGLSRLLEPIDDAAGSDVQGDAITSITRADVALGTMEFTAPEQIVSAKDVGYGADLYALGAILFRATTGRNVFGDLGGAPLARAKLTTTAPALQTGREDRVARGLEALLARALERSPCDRFASADEMLAELGRLQDAMDAESRPTVAVGAGDPLDPRSPVAAAPGFPALTMQTLRQLLPYAGVLLAGVALGLLIALFSFRSPSNARDARPTTERRGTR